MLASDDQVAIDAVAAKMMGFDPLTIGYIRGGHDDKLGVGDPREIEIVGDDVSNEFQANVRVDWIHTPGSDLFLVFDTGYLTGPLTDPRDARWFRKTGVVKLTYLRAF